MNTITIELKNDKVYQLLEKMEELNLIRVLKKKQIKISSLRGKIKTRMNEEEIDTSAVIKYLNETFPTSGISFLDKVLSEESCISFITEIELQVWNPPNQEDLKIYRSYVDQSTVFGINHDITQETIRIRKLHNLKLPDALIAATAIVNNRTLIADNDQDFKRVPKLKFINPKYI